MASRKRMLTGLGVAWAVAGLSVLWTSGCDLPPPPLRTADGKAVKTLPVDTADAEEAAAAGETQEAADHYQQALKVLQAYYFRIGALQKQTWAEDELKNLQQAQWFRFGGMPAPPPPATQSVEGPNESGLVEQVVSARASWLAKLDELAAIYDRKGLTFKAKAVTRVQERFDPVHRYYYFLNAEVPPPTLRPTEVVPAADALFERALKLYREGKPLPAITDYRKERQALLLFLQLVDQYPASTKISPAAYYIGEIYKEYFKNQEARAVMWYQRAWEWDKHVQLPARSQAAFLYDIRMSQYAKALALYREVLKYEQFDPGRIRYANQRIAELTEPKE